MGRNEKVLTFSSVGLRRQQFVVVIPRRLSVERNVLPLEVCIYPLF